MNIFEVTSCTLDTGIIPSHQYSIDVLNGSHIALLCSQQHNDMELSTPTKWVPKPKSSFLHPCFLHHDYYCMTLWQSNQSAYMTAIAKSITLTPQQGNLRSQREETSYIISKAKETAREELTPIEIKLLKGFHTRLIKHKNNIFRKEVSKWMSHFTKILNKSLTNTLIAKERSDLLPTNHPTYPTQI